MLFIQKMVKDCLNAKHVIDFEVIQLALCSCLRRFKLNTAGCRGKKSEAVA